VGNQPVLQARTGRRPFGSISRAQTLSVAAVIWLYWNRWRPAVLAVGLSLASVAALVVVAGSVVGTYEPPKARKAVAGRTGARVRHAPPAIDPASARKGLQLMQAAATACQSVSYQGVQMVAWWGSDGSSAYLLQVWHRSGGPELAKETDDSDGPSQAAQQPPASGSYVAQGVLSVSAWMLGLIRANYQIAYVGTGSASDRRAEIVAVRRNDGTLAAQFWLDAATRLPLRREIFDSGGHLVNEGAFIDLQIGGRDLNVVPAAGAQPWSSQGPALGLPGLRAQGWTLPGTLAGNMALVAVTRTRGRSGAVIDGSYSDGLSVVSIFIQRGELPGPLPGWHVAAVRGQVVYSGEPDERSIAWSAYGYVYTVLADAPPQTVQRVVAELPHDRRVGFWQRVGRGLKRMVSWFDPFG
jgi:sigma-E factor negative regulatory protein RseB